MIYLSYQVNNPLIKVRQVMMTTPWNHYFTEHQGMYVSFFIDFISLQPIYNPLVGD